MVSASRVSRSRWLVGSSSSSRLGRCQTISASVSRDFSPPENGPTGSAAWSPRKLKPPRKSRNSCSRVFGDRRVRCHSGALVGAQLLELVLGEVADLQPLALDALRRQAARARRPAVFTSVDLPAPLRPSRPRRVPGRKVSGCRATPRAAITGLDADPGPASDPLHRRLAESEFERRVDMGGGDALHALERLDAALRLARLGGLGPEAVDEGLQVRDLALLLLDRSPAAAKAAWRAGVRTRSSCPRTGADAALSMWQIALATVSRNSRSCEISSSVPG